MIYRNRWLPIRGGNPGTMEKIPFLGTEMLKAFRLPIDWGKVLGWWLVQESIGCTILGSTMNGDFMVLKYTKMVPDGRYRVCDNCDQVYKVDDSDADMKYLFCSKSCEYGC